MPRPRKPDTAQQQVTRAADRLLIADVTERKRALSDLVRHLASTWDQLPDALQQHTADFAQALHAHYDLPGRLREPQCTWCGAKPDGVTPLISGPGTMICGNCIDLVSCLAQESRDERDEGAVPPTGVG